MDKLFKALKKIFEKIAGFFTAVVVGCIVGNILIPHLVPFKHILGGIILCAVFWILAKVDLEKAWNKFKAWFKAKKDDIKESRAKDKPKVKVVASKKEDEEPKVKPGLRKIERSNEHADDFDEIPKSWIERQYFRKYS